MPQAFEIGFYIKDAGSPLKLRLRGPRKVPSFNFWGHFSRKAQEREYPKRYLLLSICIVYFVRQRKTTGTVGSYNFLVISRSQLSCRSYAQLCFWVLYCKKQFPKIVFHFSEYFSPHSTLIIKFYAAFSFSNCSKSALKNKPWKWRRVTLVDFRLKQRIPFLH